jgi:hypothetical protein
MTASGGTVGAGAVQAAGGTAATGAAIAIGAGFASGLLSFGLSFAVGMVFQLFIFPKLAGRRRSSAEPSRLLELPQSTIATGAPRVFALGRRVRVPGHVAGFWKRITTTSSGSSKVGRVTRREVFGDGLIVANDRFTNSLQQLILDGKLAYWQSRNIVTLRNSTMTVAVVDGPESGTATGGSSTTLVKSGAGWTTNQWAAHTVRITGGTGSGQARTVLSNTSTTLTIDQPWVTSPASGSTFTIEGFLKLTMASLLDIDFQHRFKVADHVRLANFLAPTTVNGDYRVQALAAHAVSAPSSVTLRPLGGQVLGAARPGDPITPAEVTRIDDELLLPPGSGYRILADFFAGGYGAGITVVRTGSTFRALNEVFRPGDVLNLSGWALVGGAAAAWANGKYHYWTDYVGTWRLLPLAGQSIPAAGTAEASPTHPAARFAYFTQQRFFPGLFGAEPLFRQGLETEGESAIAAQHETTGTIPGYRGQATVDFDELNLTEFGSRAPNVELLISPDLGMTWGDAVRLVCERAGLTPEQIDVSRMPTDQMEGFWLRGAMPTITALQPLLVAKQCVTQERADVLAFFPIEAADVVRIRNGAAFSDLGSSVGTVNAKTPKFGKADLAPEFLPTSMGVSFQDPDNVYGDGYQHFGLRNPDGAGHQNDQETGLETLVLTRQQARNLAGTLLRRLHMNSRTYTLSLPPSYSHVLENDLLTFTDDDGAVHVMRAIRVERGANWQVRVQAVRESLELEVAGSPVQPDELPMPELPPPASILPGFADIPPLLDEHAAVPGVYLFASASDAAGTWLGCAVYESLDAGTTYAQIAVLDQQHTRGEAVTTLADGTASETPGSATVTWDTNNTVEVAMAAGTLSTYSQAQVRDGRLNWALLGTEIIGFTDATLLAPGHYELSTLLRGLRRTATTAHAVGEPFVMLTAFKDTGHARLYEGVNRVGQSVHYKFVPPGLTLADVESVVVEIGGWNARPFAVWDVDVTRDGANNAEISFRPHTRLNLPVGSAGPYPFDEELEEYRLFIYDGSGYSSVVGTKTLTAAGSGSARLRGTPTYRYSAAAQTADGLTPGATLYFEVEQVGAHGASRRVRTSG